MITYFIKSGLCLAILLAFYHLVLEREKMHQFNRFYLLGSVIFSFLAPSFIIYVEAKNAIQATIDHTEKVELTNLSFFDEYVTLQNTLIILYLVVSVIFLIRFINNLHHIIKKIKVNEIIKGDHAKFVPVADEILPHTFWNYIFINKEDYSNQKIEEELFTHELAHVTQRHTFDVLILEILQVLFWFNPLFFLLKKAVQLNHEFLADDKVISSHDNISRYQTLLLSKASWKNKYYLASNLNYSLTKKRLLMMKTQNSKKKIFLKKIVVLPLLAGLVFLFADRVEAQTKQNKKPTSVKVEVVEKGATKAQMKEYKEFIKGVNKKSLITLKEIKRLRYIYNIMSGKQKKSVKNVYEFLPPPPKPVKIEVIEKENIVVEEIKEELEKIEEIEVIEEKEIEIREIKEEATEVLEVIEVTEEKEIEKEKNYLDKTLDFIEFPHKKGKKHTLRVMKLDFENLKNKNAEFYLNEKIISYKKVKGIVQEHVNIRTIRVVENKKGIIKVKITSV